MTSHFSSFTREAMRAFGDMLAEGGRARAELQNTMRERTSAMLAGFRKEHREAAHDRRERAERDADTRRIFASELRASVHALRSRFELNRMEVAGDLREMANEYRAASDALHHRQDRPGPAPRRAPPARQAQPAPPARQAAAKGETSTKKATT